MKGKFGKRFDSERFPPSWVCEKLISMTSLNRQIRALLYSGGQTNLNRRVHEELARMAGGRSELTYVAFCSDGAKTYFERAQKRYEKVGISRFRLISPDQRPTAREIRQALSADVVYLAGGNTFYFLHHLRESRMLRPLTDYARSGGILAGLSAGAILLTPSIGLAAYPDYDRDRNDIRLPKKQWEALGLVPFEFFPHDRTSFKLTESLARYSRRVRHPVFGVRDGGGLAIDRGSFKAFGAVRMFLRGQCTLLSRE